MEPLPVEELFHHVSVLLSTLYQNQTWGVKKDDSSEMVIIYKLAKDASLVQEESQQFKFEVNNDISDAMAAEDTFRNATDFDALMDRFKQEPIFQLSEGLDHAEESAFQQPQKFRRSISRRNGPVILKQGVSVKQNITTKSKKQRKQKKGSISKKVLTERMGHMVEITSNVAQGPLDEEMPDDPESENETELKKWPQQKCQIDDSSCKDSLTSKLELGSRSDQPKTDNDQHYDRYDPYGTSVLPKQDIQPGKQALNRKSKYPMKCTNGLWQCLKCPLTSKHHSVLVKHCVRDHFDFNYYCGSCPMQFKTKKALNFHADYVHNDGSGNWICPHCGQRFVIEQCLTHHVTAVHCPKDGKTKVVKCNICTETFSDHVEKNRHQIVQHMDELFFCDICSKPCEIESDLVRHMKKKHNSSQTLISCNLCRKEFIKADSLAFHQDDFHEDQDFGVARTFTCQVEYCQKRFRKETFLERHGKFHKARKLMDDTKAKKKAQECLSTHAKMIPCAVCGDLITTTYMSNHLLSHNKSLFKCADCEKGFPTTSKLKQHRIAVHERRELNCPVESCKKIFYRRDTLHHHIRSVHTHRKEHKCDNCDKTFAHKGDLTGHIKGVHGGQKSYCSFCGKAFLRNSEKNRHEKQTHNNGKEPVPNSEGETSSSSWV